MERMSGYQTRAEAGAGGDPKPTAGRYFRTIIDELRASVDSPSAIERERHSGRAFVAALDLVRVADSHSLGQIGKVLLKGAVDHPESLPVVMGAYRTIRDAFSAEKAVKAIEVRRSLGLPTRGRVFPQV